MSSPSETIRQMADTAVDALDLDALAGLPASELIELTTAIEKLGRVVDAQRIAAASAVERRSNRWLGPEGLAQSFGYRRGSELLEQLTGASGATVHRRIRLGESMTRREAGLGTLLPPLYPVVAHAVAVGQVGLDAARAIVTELTKTGNRADAHALEIAERLLVAQAAGRPQDVADLTGESGDALIDAGLPERERHDSDACPGPMPADLVETQARLWRDILDPDGVEPRVDIARVHRYVSVSRSAVNGLHALKGMLTPDVAAGIMSYFDGLLTQHGVGFTPTDVRSDPTSEARTFAQQRHDLFAAIVRSASTATDADLPTPAPLVIHADADQLDSATGTGNISGITGPVAMSYLSQFACDGGIQLLLSRNDRVVKLTTRSRFFTASQRRAVAVRDGNTCAVPGCTTPFAALEAHHVTPHSHNGRTTVDNCVLLCWWHHHMIDSGIWVVEMIRGKPRIHVPIRSNLRLTA